jgi:hypothetical protein
VFSPSRAGKQEALAELSHDEQVASSRAPPRMLRSSGNAAPKPATAAPSGPSPPSPTRARTSPHSRPTLIDRASSPAAPFGGVVLDPFGGSGTTGEVAKKHGRAAILVELNPAYLHLIHDRTNKES